MATLDEVELDALNTLGFTSGSLTERELAWLADYTGETGLTISEQWNLLLHTEGYTSGSLGERQMQLWGAMGYTGGWNERALAFWLGGGLSNSLDGIKAALLSWYTLNETSGTRADSLAAYTLSDLNTVTYVSDGVSGNAAAFNSSNNEFLTNTSWSLTAGNAWTIGGWIRMPSFPAIKTMWSILNGGTSLRAYVDVNVTTGAVRHYIAGSGLTVQTTGFTLSANTWAHIATRYDPTVGTYGTLTTFKDGVAQGTPFTLTAAPTTGTCNILRIGLQQGVNYFTGNIDEFFIATSALSDDQIAGLATGVTYADLP